MTMFGPPGDLASCLMLCIFCGMFDADGSVHFNSSGRRGQLAFTVASNTEHWQDQLQFLNSNVHGFVWGAVLDTGGPPHTGYRGQGVKLWLTNGNHAIVLMCRIVQQHGCCVIKRKVMKAVVDWANACMWNGGYDHAIHGAARAACRAAVQNCTHNHHQLTYMQVMVLLVTLFADVLPPQRCSAAHLLL